MTMPENRALTPWPSAPIPGDRNCQPSDCVLDESEDQWLNDFIKRLDCAIEDIDRNKLVLSVGTAPACSVATPKRPHLNFTRWPFCWEEIRHHDRNSAVARAKFCLSKTHHGLTHSATLNLANQARTAPAIARTWIRQALVSGCGWTPRASFGIRRTPLQ
jgi:hypothetical protein